MHDALLSPDQVTTTSGFPTLLEGFQEVFWVGFAGGLAADAMMWIENRQKVPPEFFKSKYYWFCVVLMAIIGGFLSTLYGLHHIWGLQAVNIGISAPLILRSLATSVPKIDSPRIG